MFPPERWGRRMQMSGHPISAGTSPSSQTRQATNARAGTLGRTTTECKEGSGSQASPGVSHTRCNILISPLSPQQHMIYFCCLCCLFFSLLMKVNLLQQKMLCEN